VWTEGQPLHMKATMQVYTGDLTYTRRWEEAPIKLTPPYFVPTSADEQLSKDEYAVMNLCNVQSHEEVYIGLKGGHQCAEYLIHLDFYSEGEVVKGHDAANDNGTITAATHGHYLGYHFHFHDFRGHNETLIIKVDGHNQVVNLSTHIADIDCALAAISPHLVGADIHAVNGQLKITSSSVGHNSMIDVDHYLSGTHALLLFFDTCVEFEGSHDEVSHTEVTPLLAGHYTRGSCAANGYDMFSFDIGAAHAASNLEVMVDDVTGETNAESLIVRMFYQVVPGSMESELQSAFTSDGTYSISINSHELQAGMYYVMVRCSAAAALYRLVPILTPATIGPHGVQGFVCAGSWAYHTVTTGTNGGHGSAASPSPSPSSGGTHRRQLSVGGGTTTTGNVTHARFNLLLHTGDAHYLTRHAYAPLKLVPPYGHTDSHDHDGVKVEVCNIGDEIIHFGLKGGAKCAEYELHVELFTEGPCHELEHSTADLSLSTGSSITVLYPDHFMYGSCDANGFVDFKLEVDEYVALHKNLLFEVEDRAEELNPTGLGVFLYHGSAIPDDRRTEHSQQYTSDGIYAVAVSVNDIKPGTFFLSVRCNGDGVRFKIIVHEIEALMEPGHKLHGVVCPGEWIYHKFTAVVVDHEHPLDAVFDIELHTGDLYYALRSHEPPITLAPPFHKATAEQFLVSHKLAVATACDLINRSEYWLGLRGGHVCADYVSERFRSIPLQNCLFTPELQ
jgi:hypothetical protein